VTGPQGLLLEKIKSIALKNREKKNKFKFLSEKQNPREFKTGIYEDHRLAKTDFSPDAEIVVNTDLLYFENTLKPALAIPEIAAVLVHEIGHQSGERSHSYLDTLGASLRFFLNRVSSVFLYETRDAKERMNVRVTSQAIPTLTAYLFFHWEGHSSLDMTSDLSKALICQGKSESLAGFELFNGYFIPKDELETHEVNQVYFRITAKLYCFDKNQGGLLTLQRKITFVVSKKGLESIQEGEN
jgi:hypothetical protein